nr:MAG TPA: hypothetical protein [Caudoviricetes sp.]
MFGLVYVKCLSTRLFLRRWWWRWWRNWGRGRWWRN